MNFLLDSEYKGIILLKSFCLNWLDKKKYIYNDKEKKYEITKIQREIIKSLHFLHIMYLII